MTHSRGIPSVRTWRVTWWRDGQKRDVCSVQAPTKLLARMNAWFERPDLFLANWDADKVTIHVHSMRNMCGRRR